MTKAETILWNALRDRKFLRFKFRRQAPIGPYIADFLCMAQRLIIELDGPIHEEQKEYDRERERGLFELGYRVLRFRNDKVFADLPSILLRIERSIFQTGCMTNQKNSPSPKHHQIL